MVTVIDGGKKRALVHWRSRWRFVVQNPPQTNCHAEPTLRTGSRSFPRLPLPRSTCDNFAALFLLPDTSMPKRQKSSSSPSLSNIPMSLLVSEMERRQVVIRKLTKRHDELVKKLAKVKAE